MCLFKKKKYKIFSTTTLEKWALLQKKAFELSTSHSLQKRFLENNDITLTEEYKVITIKRELAKTFDKHYINIVERSSGIKPKDLQV